MGGIKAMLKNVFHKGLQYNTQGFLLLYFLLTEDLKLQLILKPQLHQLQIPLRIFQFFLKGGITALLFGNGIF